MAAAEGATLVCLQELTLSPYFAITPRTARATPPEPIPGGPTSRFAARHGPRDRRPRARLAVRARARRPRRPRLQHRDRHRRRTASSSRARASCTSRSPPATTRTSTSGPARPTTAFRSSRSATRRFGFPTCWDQWFPELARAYSLGGAEVIVYPTAIGSEPDHPDFDTEPLWERVIVANGIANGTFMVAVNRIGTRGAARVLRLVASSATRTAASSCRRRATSRRCSSPTSTSTSAATGSTCSRSSPRAAPTRTGL